MPDVLVPPLALKLRRNPCGWRSHEHEEEEANKHERERADGQPDRPIVIEFAPQVRTNISPRFARY